MPHYVVTIDGPPTRLPDREGAERRLLITSEAGEQRPVSVVLSGQGPATAKDDDAAWKAAIYFAIEEVELGLRGEGWAVPVEDGAPFEVHVSADSIARFVGEPSGDISLDQGAVVGEFGL